MTAAADHEPKHVFSWARQALAWWLGEILGLGRDVARLVPWGQSETATIEAGERYWIVRAKGAVLGQVDCADGEDGGRALRRLVPPGRRGRSAIVELPPERVLARRVDLPAVARGDLTRLLRFEIARHFPFPAERAHFAHRTLPQRALGPDRIEIEIVAVARETVAEIRAALAAAGIAASRIVVAGGGAGGAALVLDDDDSGTTRHRASRARGSARDLHRRGDRLADRARARDARRARARDRCAGAHRTISRCQCATRAAAG